MSFTFKRFLCVSVLVAGLGCPATGVRADAVADALARGDAVGARQALEAQIKGQPGGNVLRAHLEGMIALRAGNAAQAARIFEAILAIAPSFTPAKEQLAVASRLAARTSVVPAQQRPTKAAQSGHSAPAQARRAQAGKPAAPERRRAGLNFRAALLPSSNITGGTGTDIVDIGGLPFALDAASREASGVGLTFGLTAWHGWDLAPHWTGTLSAQADARLYNTDLKPDETELGLRFDLKNTRPRGSLTFGPRINFLFQNGQLTKRQAGFGVSGDTRLSRTLAFGYSAEMLAQDFVGASYRNGRKTSASARLRWLASPRLALSAEVTALRESARAPHLAHRDIGLGLGVETELPGKSVIGIDLFAGRNTYDGPYPVFGVPRKDTVRSIGLSYHDPSLAWHGLSPKLSITRKHQASNIPIHDTWTTDIGISLVKRF